MKITAKRLAYVFVASLFILFLAIQILLHFLIRYRTVNEVSSPDGAFVCRVVQIERSTWDDYPATLVVVKSRWEPFRYYRTWPLLLTTSPSSQVVLSYQGGNFVNEVKWSDSSHLDVGISKQLWLLATVKRAEYGDIKVNWMFN